MPYRPHPGRPPAPAVPLTIGQPARARTRWTGEPALEGVIERGLRWGHQPVVAGTIEGSQANSRLFLRLPNGIGYWFDQRELEPVPLSDPCAIPRVDEAS